MAHFNYTRPGGTWATLYVPTAADYSDLDTKTFKAINGDEGGSWAPSSPIVVGGSGLSCPTGAQWELDGDLYCDGTGSFTPTITLDGGGASILFQGGGHATVDSGSAILVLNGGFLTVFSGASVSFGSGSTTSFGGTAHLLSGATFEIEAGAVLQVDASGEITLAQGNALRIADGTNPIFVTPRTVSVAQPLILLSPAGGSFSAVGPVALVDVASGGVANVLLSRLINGATLHSLTLRTTFTAHPAPSGAGNTPATWSLVKTNISTGAGTVLTTWGVDTTSGTGGIVIYFVSGGGEVIDTSQYVYWVQYNPENGTGAGAIVWWSPICNFTNLTFLGQS